MCICTNISDVTITRQKQSFYRSLAMARGSLCQTIRYKCKGRKLLPPPTHLRAHTLDSPYL